jgi:tRNA threonylcarbamoyladenosine biosynthesis protein TsaB
MSAPSKGLHLAIECSAREGAIALGQGARVLEACALEHTRRHNVALMPGIDALLRRHDAAPPDLARVSVSVGPGAFTGLRVAVSTAKMLGLVQGTALAAVPTMDAVAACAPSPEAEETRLLIALQTKGSEAYCGLFDWAPSAGRWEAASAPGLTDVAACIAAQRGPLRVVAEKLPELPERAGESERIGEEPVTGAPRAEAVLRLGAAAEPVTPHVLQPLYGRRPEAERLWAQRQETP